MSNKISNGKMFAARNRDELDSPEALSKKSGLEIMQGVLEGEFSGAPIGAAMGFQLYRVAHGEAEFRGEASFQMTNPMGTTHGGWYGTLLDSAMACAVVTTLPVGTFSTTMEYKINVTRALPAGLLVRCVGTVQHVGRSTAVANGVITGVDDGKIYATGSTTCMIYS